MTHKPFVPPEGWGNDLLSQFQSMAFENEFATFVHAPEWQHMLCDVATVLDKCSCHAMERLPKSDDPAYCYSCQPRANTLLQFAQ